MNLIYKFVPPERRTYFHDGLLRFTQPGALNDPFECTPVLSAEDIRASKRVLLEIKRAEWLRSVSGKKWEKRRVEKAVKELGRAFDRAVGDDPEKLRSEFFAQAEKKLNSRLGLLSLSRRWNSTLMWAHYSASHTGLCIGFDGSASFFVDSAGSPDGGGKLRPVSYGKERIRIPVDSPQAVSLEVMFRKSEEWAYEEEERMLALLQNAKIKKPTAPYPIHLFEVPFSTVREIIVGARADEETLTEAKTFCSTHSLPLFHALVSNRTFDMERTLASERSVK